MVQAFPPTRPRTTKHDPSVGSPLAVSSNRYNALGWRTVKRFDTSMGGYDGIDQERVMLYDAGWRMIEERVDTDLDDDADYVSQQFWGMRYIDDAVAKRINRDLEEGWTGNPAVSVWYQITDGQFSVTAVLDHKGGLYERVEYDAYGNARHRPSGDANGDGLFSFFADLPLFSGSGSIGSGGYHADWDLNFDGVVDSLDFGILTAQGTRTAALRGGWISDPRAGGTGPDNSIGYCGYVFNAERDDYTVRFRVYVPRLGRWRQTDPAGYVDGSSLYEYVRSSPLDLSDALGLSSEPARVLDSDGNEVPEVEAQREADRQSKSRECRALQQRIDNHRKRVDNMNMRKRYWEAIGEGKSYLDAMLASGVVVNVVASDYTKFTMRSMTQTVITGLGANGAMSQAAAAGACRLVGPTMIIGETGYYASQGDGEAAVSTLLYGSCTWYGTSQVAAYVGSALGARTLLAGLGVGMGAGLLVIAVDIGLNAALQAEASKADQRLGRQMAKTLSERIADETYKLNRLKVKYACDCE